RFDDAIRCMEAMRVRHEPEALVYLARHYSYIGAVDTAISFLQRAADSGFVCAPETLRSDAWLQPVRAHAAFATVLSESEKKFAGARSTLQQLGVEMIRACSFPGTRARVRPPGRVTLRRDPRGERCGAWRPLRRDVPPVNGGHAPNGRDGRPSGVRPPRGAR